jgi:hypothetical protein
MLMKHTSVAVSAIVFAILLAACQGGSIGVRTTAIASNQVATPKSVETQVTTAEPSPSDIALEMCGGILKDFAEGTHVVGAYATAERDLATWRLNFAQVNGFAVSASLHVDPIPMPDNSDEPLQEPPTEHAFGADATDAPVYICYLDGDFGRPRGDPPTNIPNWNRAVVLVRDDGSHELSAAGFADRLKIVQP